jgi:hypothetical protein
MTFILSSLSRLRSCTGARRTVFRLAVVVVNELLPGGSLSIKVCLESCIGEGGDDTGEGWTRIVPLMNMKPIRCWFTHARLTNVLSRKRSFERIVALCSMAKSKMKSSSSIPLGARCTILVGGFRYGASTSTAWRRHKASTEQRAQQETDCRLRAIREASSSSVTTSIDCPRGEDDVHICTATQAKEVDGADQGNSRSGLVVLAK